MKPHRTIASVGVLMAALSCAASGAEEHGQHTHTTGGGVPGRSPDAPPPTGYEEIDRVVEIGAVPGRMRYDIELIRVKPGEKIKLILRNTDEMPHNLLICSPGRDTAMTVAQAAWALGGEGEHFDWTPKSELVLHATRIVPPRGVDTIYFTAPTQDADYPYVCTLPGHAFTMVGMMRVGKGGVPARSARVRESLRERDAAWYHLEVGDRPRVVRGDMVDSSSRSIAVGLPGGVNYCFDAQACVVRYGWKGAFLDAGPDRGRGGTRGGEKNIPLGQRFDSGMTTFPLRIGNSDEVPAVSFRGYRITADGPIFEYDVDGHTVTHTVAGMADGNGLMHTFRMDEPQGDVRVVLEGETLTIPAGRAGEFFVTVRAGEGEK